MGLYIRRAFSFGPVRINLSRSGLGASFGVPGARIGIGPRGRYVHLGRGGVFYRRQLGRDETVVSDGALPLHPEWAPLETLPEIESAPATSMVDESSTELLAELNRVQRRVSATKVMFIVLAAIVLWLLFAGAQAWGVVMALGAAVPLLLWCRHRDVTDGTVVLNYDLEGEAKAQYDGLLTSFKHVVGCAAVWHITAAGATHDWKRNAGATGLVNRKYVRPSLGLPPRVVANIEVPCLPAGRQTLFFFPDRLLVYDSAGVGAISYTRLIAIASSTRFVESEAIPNDAQQVDRTWKFVNKKGGPDRRFNNNQELPVMLYGVLHLRSASGLNELFQTSRCDAPVPLAATFSARTTHA